MFINFDRVDFWEMYKQPSSFDQHVVNVNNTLKPQIANWFVDLGAVGAVWHQVQRYSDGCYKCSTSAVAPINLCGSYALVMGYTLWLFVSWFIWSSELLTHSQRILSNSIFTEKMEASELLSDKKFQIGFMAIPIKDSWANRSEPSSSSLLSVCRIFHEYIMNFYYQDSHPIQSIT